MFRPSAIVFLAISLAPLPALAQSGGYYLEFSAGTSASSAEPIPATSRGAEVSELNTDSAMAAITGGWRFNDNVSVEVAYVHYGTFSGSARVQDEVLVLEVNPISQEATVVEAQLELEADELEYEMNAFTASVLGTWPFRRRWSLYGELGLSAWDIETQMQGTLTYSGGVERQQGFVADFTDSGSSFFYGAGLHYRFNLSYGLRLEYQYSRIESEIFSSDAEVQNLSLGLRVYF